MLIAGDRRKNHEDNGFALEAKVINVRKYESEFYCQVYKFIYIGVSWYMSVSVSVSVSVNRKYKILLDDRYTKA